MERDAPGLGGEAEAESPMSLAKAHDLWRRYVNPDMAGLLETLGFARCFVRGEGAALFDEDGGEPAVSSSATVRVGPLGWPSQADRAPDYPSALSRMFDRTA